MVLFSEKRCLELSLKCFLINCVFKNSILTVFIGYLLILFIMRDKKNTDFAAFILLTALVSISGIFLLWDLFSKRVNQLMPIATFCSVVFLILLALASVHYPEHIHFIILPLSSCIFLIIYLSLVVHIFIDMDVYEIPKLTSESKLFLGILSAVNSKVFIIEVKDFSSFLNCFFYIPKINVIINEESMVLINSKNNKITYQCYKSFINDYDKTKKIETFTPDELVLLESYSI